MSKEIQCKCCKEYWWETNIHSQSGLCPNCYDYVSDLEHRLKVAEKALELACIEELREIGIYNDDLDYKKEMSISKQQYLEQAEKEVQGESNED